MMLYIDTNIFIDAAEGRKNKFGKTIGNPASDLFWKAAKCKYYLIISSWTLEELSKKGENFLILFKLIKSKVNKAFYTQEDIKRANRHTLWQDALHIIIAEKEKADFIVTRDFDHFLKIGTNIPIRKPEQL